jgi:hypothetical protein
MDEVPDATALPSADPSPDAANPAIRKTVTGTNKFLGSSCLGFLRDSLCRVRSVVCGVTMGGYLAGSLLVLRHLVEASKVFSRQSRSFRPSFVVVGIAGSVVSAARHYGDW